jgi:hypothetical protein
MEDFKTALRALPVKRLKEEAGKYNKSLGIINGYSKMNKEELITEMSKHSDKFTHLTKLTVKEKPEVKYIGTPTKEEKKARKMDTKELKGLPKCSKKGPFPCRKNFTKIETKAEYKEYKQLKKDKSNPLLTGLTESQKEMLKTGLINEMVKKTQKKEPKKEAPKKEVKEDKNIYTNKTSDEYEKKIREIAKQGPEALKKFYAEGHRQVALNEYQTAKNNFKNKDTEKDLLPMIQVLQRILKDFRDGLNKEEIKKFNEELIALSIRLENVRMRKNEEIVLKNAPFYNSMLDKIKKGNKLTREEKEKFDNYERFMNSIKKKIEPKSEVKEIKQKIEEKKFVVEPEKKAVQNIIKAPEQMEKVGKFSYDKVYFNELDTIAKTDRLGKNKDKIKLKNDLMNLQFQNDLYTTPQECINKIFSEIDFEKEYYKNINVLEPSAGTGMFIRHIIDMGDKHSIKTLDANEYSPDLFKILKDKTKLSNIYNKDFLQFKQERNYDLIIMNPPYSQYINSKDEKKAYLFHLVKAMLLTTDYEKEIFIICPEINISGYNLNIKEDALNKRIASYFDISYSKDDGLDLPFHQIKKISECNGFIKYYKGRTTTMKQSFFIYKIVVIGPKK